MTYRKLDYIISFIVALLVIGLSIVPYVHAGPPLVILLFLILIGSIISSGIIGTFTNFIIRK